MFNGKLKAVTFSFDDGVTQDKRMVQLLNKYGLKATFNINSGLLSHIGSLNQNGVTVNHTKVHPYEMKDVYAGHEVAVHTITHPNLTTLEKDEDVIYQVEYDRKNLEYIMGYPVIGMAYPCGGVNNDDRVAKIIKENTGVKYSRTITSTESFDLQDNLYRFNPSVHYINYDTMIKLGKEFIELKTDVPKIFYIWGHSYEMDAVVGWEKLEEFFKMISGHDDIFYGTNKEVLLAK